MEFNFNPRSHKGSDYVAASNGGYQGISIHAPTRGATVQELELLNATLISIHAPTRGATLLAQKQELLQQFQSTLPQGERRASALGDTPVLFLFQSTLPQGERHCLYFVPFTFCYFNPRSHKGSDVSKFFLNRFRICISIHAPTRGATKLQHQQKYATSDFNPRSHKGSDCNFPQF